MLDYYETENYIITHGWIPCIHEKKDTAISANGTSPVHGVAKCLMV